MQFRAIFTAAAELIKEGLNPKPEIMVPVTLTVKELDDQKRYVTKYIKKFRTNLVLPLITYTAR